jgi:hypothetical protein
VVWVPSRAVSNHSSWGWWPNGLRTRAVVDKTSLDLQVVSGFIYLLQIDEEVNAARPNGAP